MQNILWSLISAISLDDYGIYTSKVLCFSWQESDASGLVHSQCFNIFPYGSRNITLQKTNAATALKKTNLK